MKVTPNSRSFDYDVSSLLAYPPEELIENYIVSGAGTDSANGTYYYTGEEESHPYYVYQTPPEETYDRYLYKDGSYWCIAHSLGAPAQGGSVYYSGDPDEPNGRPPLTGWTKYSGALPVPTITKG